MPDIIQARGPGQPLIRFKEQADGTHAEVVEIVGGGGGGSTVDREVVVTTYRVIQDGTGYTVGQILTATRVLDVSGASATQVGSTVWYNESSGAAISAPNSGHIEVTGQPGLTNAQLRAQAVSVSIANTPNVSTDGLTNAQLRAAPVGVVASAAVASASFTRPADTTSYAAGDLIANSTTAGSVAPMSFTAARVAAGSFLVNRIRLRKSTTTLTSATFRVYLFNTAPTVANGDNGALSIAGSANCIGWADITFAARGDSATTSPFSDGAFGFGDLTSLVALASGQTVWALIESRAAYAPGNGETFAVTLELAQN